MKIEISLSDLLAQAHERGRAAGHAEGLAEGWELGQRLAVERLRKLQTERSGSPHDVGARVLRDAIERCSATRSDIDPMQREGAA